MVTVEEILNSYYLRDDFAGLILVAWGYVEAFTDVGVRLEFGLTNEDPRCKFLLQRSPDSKLRFLKDRGFFTPEEFAKVKEFKTERNNLFHDYIKSGVEVDFILFPQRRHEIMDRARDAALIAMNALFRTGKTKKFQPATTGHVPKFDSEKNTEPG